MPIIFEKQIDTAKKLAVWHITESDEELFNSGHKLYNPAFTIKRNREMSVSALLLNYLTGYQAHLQLAKDAFGKPYIADSEITLSFSHSQDMVACIIDRKGQAVGIDIEMKRERISMIAGKFCTEKDTTHFEGTMHYHLIWGGKEVLYKVFARKELDFREHLSVQFNSISGRGEIRKGSAYTSHLLAFEMLDDFVLVWGF